MNADERKMLAVLRSHLGRIWTEVAGAAVTEAEELKLLNLIWVQILEFEEGELGVREAKDLLRSSALENTAQADVAWNSLVAACAGYGASKSGADRPALQRQLLASQIHVKAPRSYRTDIARLCRHRRQRQSRFATSPSLRLVSASLSFRGRRCWRFDGRLRRIQLS